MLSQRLIRNTANFFVKCKTTGKFIRHFSSKNPRSIDFGTILLANVYFPSSISVYPTRGFASKADSELIAFLKEEIEAEKKIAAQNSSADGERPSISGFQIATDQREVTLTKKHGEETITVNFDVNHTVDVDEVPGAEDQTRTAQAEAGGPKMVSKPDFTVTIAKGDRKLVFECAYMERTLDPSIRQEDYGDQFEVDIIYMYTGELSQNSKFYAVSGDIIDGTLYDHLMNFLEERGIDNNFAQQLIRFSTNYEHNQYVGLLQKLRDFLSK